ncbi:hypothetical protein CROQUDRAFT_671557 [Cronartium quercuum f. sp. fusiforme G11]|uniref:Uncharacterized protein n=1 Tax=Cronartium quercuum f. sp. fusiforme G11 TaxID=708437 RepID=A0A9P6NGT9_9BASI|nr:hypothetical protein CROQUDRAFT_671557 [Cronartium quercuum f. sp. fusiforme G11]
MGSIKGSRLDYDAIEKLGNPGWGWSDFDRASKKSEHFIVPKPSPNLTYQINFHGQNGSVKNSLPKYLPPPLGNFFPAFQQVGHEPKPTDTYGGDLKGPYYYPATIDDNAERVTSATAYYSPSIASRPNLIVRLHSEVDKVLTSKSKNGKLVVKAVQYISDGTHHKVWADREVILSAGVFGSPAILERSGMGDPVVLNKFGIPVLNKLPGVGANLGDHYQLTNTYQLLPGLISADNLTTNATYAAEQYQLYKTHREGILTQAISLFNYEPLQAFLTKEEIEEGMSYLKTNSSSPLPERVFKIIKEQLQKGTPVEFAVQNKRTIPIDTSPNASYISFFVALQYPLSRGSSHISSIDPLKSPTIDAGYYSNPFDLWLISKSGKSCRKILSTSSMKEIIKEETLPGKSVKTEEDWKKFAKETVRSFHHQIGTTSMLPFKDGGVVDSNLLVYGTNNLRVIDAGIIPIPLAMHITMTVYAIGELGAERILKKRNLL